MPHPIVFKGAQLGIQSVLNTAVPADIKLLAPGFSRINARSTGGYSFTAAGNRLPTGTVPPGYKEGEVSIEGPMDYVCMLYILSSYFGLPTPAADGTNGWAWDFSLGLATGTTRTLFTYMNGNAARAESAMNAFVNSLTMNFSKGTQSYNGVMITGAKQRGITITAAPDEVAPVIIPPQKFNLYYAASKAALDTAVSTDAKMLTPFPIDVVLTFPEAADRQGRMNSAEESYAAINEKALVPTFGLKVTDEAAFDALGDLIDDGTPAFFAVQALGAVIAGAVPSQFELLVEFCGTLIEPESNEEDASSAANMLNFQNQYDATWTKAHNIRMVTSLPDLTP